MPLPIYLLCRFLIVLFRTSFVAPPPLSLLFPSRFTLACSFRSRTESINSLIFLTLFTTLFLASTYMSDPTHPPQILPSHSFSPNILMCPISHPFSTLTMGTRPPSPTPVSHQYTRTLTAHKYPIWDKKTVSLICIRLSFLPFSICKSMPALKASIRVVSDRLGLLQSAGHVLGCR